jgi:hypothetical protein
MNFEHVFSKWGYHVRPAEENKYQKTECWEAELIPTADKPSRKVYTYAANEEQARIQFAQGGITVWVIQAIRLAPPLEAKLLADNAPQRETRK